jgi:hypothetical protein
MTETPRSRIATNPPPRWAPPSPSAALIPGIVLVFSSLWMLTDHGPLVVGWACFTIGLAFLLTGTVAQGVAWGLNLHKAQHE